MALDDAADDGQAQAGALFAGRAFDAGLVEGVEDGVEFVGGDALALVFDRDDDLFGAFDGDLNSAVGGLKFDSVADEVVEHLLDFAAVDREPGDGLYAAV